MLQRVLRFLDPLILSMSYKELPPNLDEYSENDALNAWTALSPLLRRRKIWLFDSEEYNNHPPPPHKEPSDPFRVKDDETSFSFLPASRLAVHHFTGHMLVHYSILCMK